MPVSISKGNKKLGFTPNVNLDPRRTCKDMPCFKSCYARCHCRWPAVANAWGNNLDLLKRNPNLFGASIVAQLKAKSKPVKYFRWHSGGELISQNHLDLVYNIARACPETNFLLFTKRFELDFSEKPANLSLAFSSWPGEKIPADILKNHRIAWMQDGTETRIGKRNHYVCPAVATHGKVTCNECRRCWRLSKDRTDVVFPKHA